MRNHAHTVWSFHNNHVSAPKVLQIEIIMCNVEIFNLIYLLSSCSAFQSTDRGRVRWILTSFVTQHESLRFKPPITRLPIHRLVCFLREKCFTWERLCAMLSELPREGNRSLDPTQVHTTAGWRYIHLIPRALKSYYDTGYKPAFQHVDQGNIDGLVQDCSNSIVDALELRQSCTKPLIYPYWNLQHISAHIA